MLALREGQGSRTKGTMGNQAALGEPGIRCGKEDLGWPHAESLERADARDRGQTPGILAAQQTKPSPGAEEGPGLGPQKSAGQQCSSGSGGQIIKSKW